MAKASQVERRARAMSIELARVASYPPAADRTILPCARPSPHDDSCFRNRPTWGEAMRVLALVAGLLNVPNLAASAQDWMRGSSFYTLCNEAPAKPADDWSRLICTAYVKGLADMAGYLQPANKAGLVCAPEGTTVSQYLDMLVKYLRDNPARQQELTPELLWEAASKSYPCPPR